jgi:hypothetical protein
LKWIKEISEMPTQKIQAELKLRTILSVGTLLFGVIFVAIGAAAPLLFGSIIAIFSLPLFAGIGFLNLVLSIIADLQFRNLKVELRLRALENVKEQA